MTAGRRILCPLAICSLASCAFDPSAVPPSPGDSDAGDRTTCIEGQDRTGEICNATPPIAVDDFFVILEDSESLLPVLANDSAPSKDGLAVDAIIEPRHGRILSFSGEGFAYLPHKDFFGSDEFLYRIQDRDGQSSTAAVHLRIEPVNDPPAARDLRVRTGFQIVRQIQLQATDIDDTNVEFSIVSTPEHGTLRNAGDGSAWVTYSPALGFSGFDSFTYQARDPSGAESVEAQVTVLVLPPSWWHSDWCWRQKLAFDGTNLPDGLRNLQALVKLDGTWFRYGRAQAHGEDLRFVDSNGLPLPHEIEHWDPDGASFLWVRIPQVPTATVAHYWMYYGNRRALDAQNPAAVWEGEDGVWHLSDGLTNSASLTLKSATVVGTTPIRGPFGAARRFDGLSFIDLEPGTLRSSRGSVALWVRKTSTSATGGHELLFYGTDAVGGSPDGFGTENEIHLGFDPEHRIRFNIGGPPHVSITSPKSYADGAWHFVAATWSKDRRARLYVDGIEVASTSHNGLDFLASRAVRLGGPIAFRRHFVGEIDEVRVSSRVFSAPFIRA